MLTSNHIIGDVHTYGTCHKKLYEIRQSLRKICADSVKLPCSCPRNCSTTSAESVSHFRGMVLRCPRICPYPVNVFAWNVSTVYEYDAQASRWQLRTHIKHFAVFISLRLLVTDSKTTVGTYTAVIRTLHYCSKDWGTNVLPTCPPPQSELVPSPASILSYEDHYVHFPRAASTIHSYVQYRYDAIPPFRLLQADYASTILGIHFSYWTTPQSTTGGKTSTVTVVGRSPHTIFHKLYPKREQVDLHSTMPSILVRCRTGGDSLLTITQ